MRDTPGGELDPADDVCRRCKKNSSVISCIDKRTKEDCDRGSEWTVLSGRDREWSVPLRKLKESGSRESYVKNFVSR